MQEGVRRNPELNEESQVSAAQLGVMLPLRAQPRMKIPVAHDNADTLTGSVVELEMFQQNKMDEKVEGEQQNIFFSCFLSCFPTV